MRDDTAVNDFSYIKKTLFDVFRRMREGSSTRLYEKPVVQRGLTEILWMLHHQYYPSPHQVEFIISLLREEKFRIVREEDCQSVQVAEIQSLIDDLKDIRKFLQLVTQYDSDGCIITLNTRTGHDYTSLFLCGAIVFTLCTAQFIMLAGYSPPVVYLCAVSIFYPVLLFLEKIPIVIACSGLFIFSLLSVCIWS
ncbi:hypothetical protein ABSZ42_003472 [Salmonella enterica subsp. enterica serovar Newport]|uniref:hypothetical protein n=1 Tax=Salmonella enterica TaxID=28901 RepID=UPI0012B839D5|nr:hypothetical protein [Salmonella enterica]EBQ5245702.1 hypothetical protein [Salmonella enterica subsp. salamae]ECD4557508.1 hypothetical protein [Salmonella enterica subsp. enterica serovar Newport]ECO1514475.1 hypothetical protein [Salmonella enterica subsp. arizonae]HEB6948977.1 hypothetical protein [Salmonella enterica subsp. enterica serovar Hvittingfoss]ECM1815400.1 hypothetical protein [Salmonella enterica subsp. enterica serovar Newport]